VFFGNKICHDQPHAGITGAVLATLLITASTYVGFHPADWITAMVINITIVQSISPTHASHGLGTLWLLRERNRMEGKK
jgi:energy-converting hydrogenase Eha subunit B